MTDIETPVVNVVEMVAELTKGWERQTTRIVQAMFVTAALGILTISGINWGVQYRLSRSRAILESTQMGVQQNRDMIDSLKEDRVTSELRFRTILAAIKSVEIGLDKRKRR